jgi:hypothetical protein
MIVIAVIGATLFCVLVYRFALYAVPTYLGFASAFWAFDHGAGAGGLVVGIGVAFVTFTLTRHIAENGHPISRKVVITLFALPAAYAGFEIVEQLSAFAVPSPVWRAALALLGGIAIGIASAAKISPHLFVRDDTNSQPWDRG